MQLRRSLSLAAALFGCTLLLPIEARAVDAETIVQALMPKPRPQGPVVRSFKSTRGIEVEGGETKEEAPPRIDLYVHFEYDQSNLTMSDARLTLDALGKALQDPRLARMKFAIIGHTDARGTDAYNDELSRKRAEAVRQYLVQYHRIDAGLLQASGKGRRQLKDASRPEDGINRRVEIRTLLDGTS
jgi:outer membrane protein OmpA-like peptidoglycan-associated protein